MLYPDLTAWIVDALKRLDVIQNKRLKENCIRRNPECLTWSGSSAIKGINLDAAWPLLAWPSSLIGLSVNGPDLDLTSLVVGLFKLPNTDRSAKEIVNKNNRWNECD